MGIFSDIKNARGSIGGNYFRPGNFVVEIQRVKKGETRKKVDMVAIETKVIESDTAEIKPGALVSQLLTFDKDAALGNYADFLRMAYWQLARNTGTATAAEPGAIELDEPMADAACGVDNIFAGLKLGLQCFNKKTQKGNDFTRHIWMGPAEAQAHIKTARDAQAAQPAPAQPAQPGA